MYSKCKMQFSSFLINNTWSLSIDTGNVCSKIITILSNISAVSLLTSDQNTILPRSSTNGGLAGKKRRIDLCISEDSNGDSEPEFESGRDTEEDDSAEHPAAQAKQCTRKGRGQKFTNVRKNRKGKTVNSREELPDARGHTIILTV